jgi:galactokinase
MKNDPRGHFIEAALADAGLESSEWPGRTALMERAIEAFTSATGAAPAWAWLVPGRIEVFGKHTDYAGGRSLVTAVPRGFALVASPRDDGRVVARDARWNASTVIHSNDQSTAFHGWANYIAVVTRRLSRNFPGATLGIDITFVSDLPRAAGVSSSSALVVGVALALIRRGGLDARPEWQAVIHDRLDLAGYLGAVENGLTFRSLAGTSGVGTHGGSEDHTAILNCRPGAVSAFSYVPTRPLGDAHVPDDWRFIIMPSGVEAAKAGGARLRYNTASLATQALADVWRRHAGETEVRTLAHVLSTDANAETTLREAITRHPHTDFSFEALDRRLSHFLAEDARVLPALAAFQAGNRDRLGALTLASQSEAESLLGNQIPETSALAELAREAGAFAASSFGAGFGGSVWALATAGDAEAVTERWRAAYAARFPALATGAPAIVRPGTAALRLDLPAGQKIES